VIGSHGHRAVGRLLLGSQANEVLAHSEVPALIVRCCTDRSDKSIEQGKMTRRKVDMSALAINVRYRG
jgi:universal stress protein family protein